MIDHRILIKFFFIVETKDNFKNKIKMKRKEIKCVTSPKNDLFDARVVVQAFVFLTFLLHASDEDDDDTQVNQ